MELLAFATRQFAPTIMEYFSVHFMHTLFVFILIKRFGYRTSIMYPSPGVSIVYRLLLGSERRREPP